MIMKKFILGTIITLIALGIIAWITGFRIYYVHDLYVPICPNFKSMRVNAICTDWGAVGRCDYLKVLKGCD